MRSGTNIKLFKFIFATIITIRARTNKPRQRFFQRVRQGSGCPEGEEKTWRWRILSGTFSLTRHTFVQFACIWWWCTLYNNKRLSIKIVQQKNNLIAIIHQSFTRNRGNDRGHDKKNPQPSCFFTTKRGELKNRWIVEAWRQAIPAFPHQTNHLLSKQCQNFQVYSWFITAFTREKYWMGKSKICNCTIKRRKEINIDWAVWLEQGVGPD